jgi:GNAT superfamily N-acetyltransferase
VTHEKLGWATPTRVPSDRLIGCANLLLPNMGFSSRTLNRLTVEDPCYRDDLSGVFVDEKGDLKAGFFTAMDPSLSKAWLTAVFCDGEIRDEFKRQLKVIVSLLKQRGVKEVRCSDRGGYHFRAGLDEDQKVEKATLVELGFEKTKSVVDYELDLRLFANFRSQRFQVDKYVLQQTSDAERLLVFVEKTFGLGWRRETEASLKNGGVVEVVNGDGVVGFAAYGGFESHWFGPIGVLPEHRQHGLGTQLLFAALTRMREAGIQRVVIPWTNQLTFYAQTNSIVKISHLNIMRLQK